MKTKSTHFVEQYLAGDAGADDIYAFIDRWHESDNTGTLATYLGMTADEYARWVEKPETLDAILTDREKRSPVAKVARA